MDKEKEQIRRIKAILSILKIDDHHTSKKQLQNALKEIDAICSEQETDESSSSARK